MRTTRYIILLFVAVLFFAGCVYDSIEPSLEMSDDVDMDPVSFSDDILPIFISDCLGAGCHGEGAIPPILTEERAYEDLMEMNSMVIVDEPDKSILYHRMVSTQWPMPPAGALPRSKTDLVLWWIAQGAEDN